MSQTHIAQLRSDDPEQRRQAIIALGKARDRRALQALAHVYRHDPVPELRDLAYKAGRYITQQTQPQTVQPPQPLPAETYALDIRSEPDTSRQADDDAMAGGWQDPSRLPAEVSYGTGLSTAVAVSKQDVERATSYYNRALDLMMKHDPVKAAQELLRALELNPNLAYDLPTRNLAAGILHVQPEEAIAVLRDPARRQLYLGDTDARSSQWGRKKRQASLARKSPGAMLTSTWPSCLW